MPFIDKNKFAIKLAAFYIPLALTSVMMNVTSTVVNSVLSYMENSIIHLAAFAGAFAVATLTHSPVFAVQQIAISKATSKKNTKMLMIYFLIISLLLFFLNMLIAFTPFGEIIFLKYVGASEAVTVIAQETILSFLPLPVIIAFRGILQGMIIRNEKTGIISIATFVRLISLILFLILLSISGYAITAPVAGWGLSLAVFTETVILIPRSIKYFKQMEISHVSDATNSQLMRFSWPLIISMVMWTSSGFFVVAVVGHSVNRDAALAVAGIIYASIGWFLASPTKPIMQMALVFSGIESKISEVRHFAYKLVAVLSLLISLIQIPALNEFIFSNIFVLPSDLREIAVQASALILFYPALIAHRGYLQGVLIFRQKTFPISFAATIRMAFLMLAAFISMHIVYDNGAIMGIAILLSSIFFENILLMKALSFSGKTQKVAIPR